MRLRSTWYGGIAVGLGFLVLVAILGSQYVRQLSIDSGPFRETAILILGLTDSREDQRLTMACVSAYFGALTFLLVRLRRTGTSLGESCDSAFWWPEICLWVFIGRVIAAYAFDYQSAYFFSDCLTLVAGVTIGRAVAVLRLWRKDEAWDNGLYSKLLPALILLLSLAALLHPYMGRTFYYREHERWIGPYYNPNTYGLLMGVGVVLALGSFIGHLSMGKRHRTVRRSDESFVRRTSSGLRPPSPHSGEGIPSDEAETSRSWHWVLAAFFSIAAVVCGFGLLKSYSRGAWLGTFCGLAYLAALMAPGLWRKIEGARLRRWRPLIPAVILLLVSMVVLGFWNFRHTEQRLVRRAFSVGNPNDFSWRNRVTAGVGALQMMGDRPWLGFGWNQVEKSYTDLYRPPRMSESSAISMNDYFVLGVSVGLPALMGMLIYVGWRFLTGHRRWMERYATPTMLDWKMLVCRSGFLVLLVGFAVEKGIFYVALGAPFWILLELGSETGKGGPKLQTGSREELLEQTPSAASEPIRPASTLAAEPVRLVLTFERLKRHRRTIYAGVATAVGIAGVAWLWSARSSEPRDPGYRKVLAHFQTAQPVAVNISPDGHYFVTKIEMKNGFKISIVDRETGREVAGSFSKHTQRSLTWRPDSRALAFQDSPGADRPLYLLDVDSGKTRRLNAPASQTALPPLRWDSRGRRLAYYQGDWRSGQLLVIDVGGEAPLQVIKKRISGDCDFVWSPSSDALAVVSQSEPGVTICQLGEVETSEFILDVGGAVGEVVWSPDGRLLLATARGAEDEYYKLVGCDIGARSVTVKAALQGDIKSPLWLPQQQGFIYHVLSDGVMRAMLRSGADAQERTIGPTNGVLHVTHVSADGARAYARFAALTTPPVLLELPLGGEPARVICSVTNSDSLSCPAPQPIRLNSSDGLEVPAYHWQSTAVGKKARSVLIVVHGGLHTQTYPTWELYLRVMLDQGCDVIALNYRGSSGYGRSFETAGSEPERVEDLLAARRYALDALNIPARKIYLYGISSGAALCVKTAARGVELGGLMLVSSVAVAVEEPPQISGSLRIVELHGDSDLAVSAERAHSSLRKFFSEAASGVQLDCHVLKGEGHFFYKSASWARVYWEVLGMGQME